MTARPTRIVVFAGPSLGRDAGAMASEFVLRPPAACGDIARAVGRGVGAIALIDGAFETTASPWPKELLWAMERGVAVYGAASLGALRAVELAPFGMIGVGRIFEAYRRGSLIDDDEVAVLHGPREAGYAAVSEAMVNIRATLLRARRAAIIDAGAHGALIARAKATFYKDRSYDRLLSAAECRGIPRPILRRLAAWLPAHRVDAKRIDALALLALLRRHLAEGIPRPPRIALKRTTYWRAFCARHGVADRA